MKYETILYNVKGTIAIVTLNRPERLNAINRQMLAELDAVLDEIEENEDVRVVILSGNERSFSSGADLKDQLTVNELRRANRLDDRIETFDKVIIAAIEGYCLGGGLEISLCCDLRVASETASIGVPEIKSGAFPPGGTTFRLAQIVGTGRAKEIIYTGDPVSGHEAYNIGLVNRLTPPGKALDEAEKLARYLSDRAPTAMWLAKLCTNMGTQLQREAATEFNSNALALLRSSKDAQEARRTFVEKKVKSARGKGHIRRLDLVD